jgi:hypothetical protein
LLSLYSNNVSSQLEIHNMQTKIVQANLTAVC